MNKLRISNIGMNKHQQNTLGKATATTTAQSSDLLLQAKKKRTAFGNLSNATSAKDDVSKKVRFTNPASFLTLGKKDSSNAAAKKITVVNQENLANGSKSKKAVTKKEAETLPDKLAIDCKKLELNDQHVKTEAGVEGKVENLACQIKGWVDIDAYGDNDVDIEFNLPYYTVQIFKYYRQRQAKFTVDDYLKRQPSLSKQMRLLLIDWIVEVQQQLEFNHEVLYLSVKLLDLYLNNKRVDKEKLQVLGGAAMFIACKYEERIPPALDDFIFVSDNAYDRSELTEMEIDILHTVQYDIGAPLSYTFLRRYAKCLTQDMQFLTLARYILELSLQDYGLASVSESSKACAALYLAMHMKMNENKAHGRAVNAGLAYTDWSPTLIYYTEAFLKDFIDLLPVMNNLVKNAPNAKYKTIYNKYSHSVFYESSKVEPLPEADVKRLMEINDNQIN